MNAHVQELYATVKHHGFRIRVRHERRAETTDEWPTADEIVVGTKARLAGVGLTPSPKGGSTIVSLFVPVQTSAGQLLEEIARGEARCSLRDNFNRERGLEIALGRALKEAGSKYEY